LRMSANGLQTAGTRTRRDSAADVCERGCLVERVHHLAGQARRPRAGLDDGDGGHRIITGAKSVSVYRWLIEIKFYNYVSSNWLHNCVCGQPPVVLDNKSF
jgi:hypothetical protein